ncbi:MAG: PTS sugar transporter subunit IIA [Sphingomonadales bacterium]
MIGLILVTHGRLAEEFVAATEHVVGTQEFLRAICIGPDDDMDLRLTEIKEAVTEVNQGKGVVILTDMFGGTPSNLALTLLEKGKVEVLAGINLPMLIKLASIRKTTALEDAVAEAAKSGKKYINIASEVLNT